MPLFDAAWRNVDSRMRAGPLRTNNAIEAFVNACALPAKHDDLPHICRFLEAVHIRRNMKCGETLVATQGPFIDRETADLEAVRTNRPEGRQGRGARGMRRLRCCSETAEI